MTDQQNQGIVVEPPPHLTEKSDIKQPSFYQNNIDSNQQEDKNNFVTINKSVQTKYKQNPRQILKHKNIRAIINPKYYQSVTFAKTHYNKIKEAKPCIKMRKKPQHKSTPIKNIDPLQLYDFVQENSRICRNLIKIENSPSYLETQHYMTVIPKNKKSKRNRGKSISHIKNSFRDSQHQEQKNNRKSLISSFLKKQEHQAIIRQNINIGKRLENIKPTIGGWKQRQKQLSSYSKISRKKFPKDAINQNNMELQQFEKFRRTLIAESRRGLNSNHRRRRRRGVSTSLGHRNVAII